MEKRIFLLFSSIIFFVFNLFAHNGVMTGQKNLRIVSTEYFDIIYAPGSEKSAEIMLQKADGVYNELAEKFQLKNRFRLPVVISPAHDDFNAYFSSFPFNHIVMYDTLPVESILTYSETFINTFRHELIHAVTYNLRNDAWFKIDRILGDVYNPALLTITTGWAEGATVSVESDFGEGRMNSEYAKQILKQAKIDGVFPKYSEIQGAMDFYPSTNASYIFGGAFCKWLQETYGMKKYALFWEKCVNFKTITYFSCFKSVYGISIKKAWKNFYDSIEIPSGIEIKKTKRKNISYYKSLAASKNGVAFIDLYKSGIYFRENGKNRAKLLFSQHGLNKISLSKDGKFLAVSYLDESYGTAKGRVYLYDFQKKATFSVAETDIRDGAVFSDGSDYYVAFVKAQSEYSTLNVLKIKFGKNGIIAGLNPIFKQTLEYGDLHYSLEGGENGNLYYVLKSGMNFAVCRYNAKTDEIVSFPMPEPKMPLHHLSVNGEKVYFSYAKNGSMPRLGMLLETEKDSEGDSSDSQVFSLMLSSDDFSGGIQNPVYDGEKIEYIASYFNGFEIKTVFLGQLKFEQFSVVAQKQNGTEESKTIKGIDSSAKSNEIAGSKKFNSFAYTFNGPHGAFLPVALTTSNAINSSAEEMMTMLMPFGVTYMTSSPWTNPLFYISAGYGLLTNSYGLKAGIFRSGTATDLLSYSGSAQIEFDGDGYKQTYETFSISSSIPLFRTISLGLGERFEFFEGRQSKTSFNSDDVDSFFDLIGILSKEKSTENLSTNRIFLGNYFSASIGNIHRAGKSYFNYAGVKATTSLDFVFCTRVANLEDEYYKFANLSFTLSGRIPGYIPISLEASLFPKQLYIGYFAAKAYLLSWEIQRSTNFLPLIYLNRLSLTAQYTGKFKEETKSKIKFFNSMPIDKTYDYLCDIRDGNAKYYDQLEFMANLYFTPNFGGFARTDFQLKASFGYVYRFTPEPSEKSGGFAVSINFVNLTF